MKKINTLRICLIMLCVGQLYGNEEVPGLWGYEQELPADAFMRAACKGDIPAVKKILDDGMNIDVQDSCENTALIYAAQNNKFDMVLFLLERGANMHIASKGFFSPLEAAIESGNLKIVALLLYSGAHNGTHSLRMTAIHNNKKVLAMLFLHNPLLSTSEWFTSQEFKNLVYPFFYATAKALCNDAERYLNEHPDIGHSVRTIMDTVRNDPRVIDVMQLQRMRNERGGIIAALRNREIGLNYLKK